MCCIGHGFPFRVAGCVFEKVGKIHLFVGSASAGQLGLLLNVLSLSKHVLVALWSTVSRCVASERVNLLHGALSYSTDMRAFSNVQPRCLIRSAVDRRTSDGYAFQQAYLANAVGLIW